ncbi:MAG: FKBP-type peptidyl-prolyl cis-trans isomerase [Planctomycetota bacterium]
MGIHRRVFALAVMLVSVVLLVGGPSTLQGREKAKPTGKEDLAAFPDIKDDDPRWVKLESGLWIAHIKEGKGACVKLGDQYVCAWAGFTLSEMRMFDASASGAILAFKKGASIEGWMQGLPLIKEGGYAILRVPPQLAYGENEIPSHGIKANETLYFKVKLVKVIPGKETPKETPEEPGNNTPEGSGE